MCTSVNVWVLMLIGQATGGVPGSGTVSDDVKVQSIWDFVVKGGPVMIPLGVCSLVALAIILERMVSLRRRNVIPSGFLAGLRRPLSNGVDGRDEALEYCQTNGSPIAMVLYAGIKHLSAPREWLEKCMAEAAQRQVLKLRKYLRALALIVSISPMLGLLGTVTGMVRAFQTVAASSEALGKAELLAKGIYEALITTVAGLCIAIPVLIAFHWFSARIEWLVNEMDRVAAEFVDEHASARVTQRGRRPTLQALEESDEPPITEEEVGAAAAS